MPLTGKGATAVLPLLWRLRLANSPAAAAVALGMASLYQAAVQTALPRSTTVFDPYHVRALAHRAVDDTRRDVCRLPDRSDRPLIKVARFLLHRGQESLDASLLEKLMFIVEANHLSPPPIF